MNDGAGAQSGKPGRPRRPTSERNRRKAEAAEVESLLDGIMGREDDLGRPAAAAKSQTAEPAAADLDQPAPAPPPAPPQPAAPTTTPKKPAHQEPAEAELVTWEKFLGYSLDTAKTNIIEGPIPGLKREDMEIVREHERPDAAQEPQRLPPIRPSESDPISVVEMPAIPQETLAQIKEVSDEGIVNPFAVPAQAEPGSLQFEAEIPGGPPNLHDDPAPDPVQSFGFAFEPDDDEGLAPAQTGPPEVSAPVQTRPPKGTGTAQPPPPQEASPPEPPAAEPAGIADRLSRWLASKARELEEPPAEATPEAADAAPAADTEEPLTPSERKKIDWLAKARRKRAQASTDEQDSGAGGAGDPASESGAMAYELDAEARASLQAGPPALAAVDQPPSLPDQTEDELAKTHERLGHEVELETADPSRRARSKEDAGLEPSTVRSDGLASAPAHVPEVPRAVAAPLDPPPFEPDARAPVAELDTAEPLRLAPSPLENLESSLYFEPPLVSRDSPAGRPGDSGILQALGEQIGPGRPDRGEIEDLISQRVKLARSTTQMRAISATQQAIGPWRRLFSALPGRMARWDAALRRLHLPLGNLLFTALFTSLVAIGGGGVSWLLVPAAAAASLLATVSGLSWRDLAASQGVAMIAGAGLYLAQNWQDFFLV